MSASPVEAPPPSVVIAEDDRYLLPVMVRMLKPEGYAVDTAPSGTEALALLLSLNRPADLLIADLNLPDMSGTLLAEAAFTQGLARRVLFVSGYGEDPHAMAPVLGKPFSCDELCRRVAALVRGVAAFLACVSV